MNFSIMHFTCCAALLVGLTVQAGADDANAVDIGAAMRNSFAANKQAGMDRLEQDETQRLCSAPADTLPQALAARVAQINRATLKPPADGNYLGDFRQGERIAQIGTGLQWSDDVAKPNGGNCYACHELSPQEVAFGTIGPSLKHYAKLRGTTPQMLEYTWNKLYNSNAMMPCSNMPRFGHRGILTEQQLKDVMAYLFDAQSPVNE